jgi:hypothetical protein
MDDADKRIDYEKIAAGASPEHKMRIAQSEMARVGYVSLSDALTNRDRDSVVVLQALDAMDADGRVQPVKLKILRDRHGNPPVPGDVWEWKYQIRTRNAFGQKYDSGKIKEMQRRGDDDHVIYHSAVVDADGCITVPYRDASNLLHNHGVHWFSKMPISGMKEHSREPEKTDRGLQHRWNWLYMEVPPWISATEATTESAKKRGRPKKIAAVPEETMANDGRNP